jgi:factor associated with neutral sphingomyelinase activation
MALKLTEFHSVPRPDKAFNLLYLDAAEYLISSVPARLSSPEYESETGKLHLCTRSILFQPSNSKLPLLRFKLSNPDFRFSFALPASHRPASQRLLSPKSAQMRPGAWELPATALVVTVDRFEVITRDPCGPRFSQPAGDGFAFELSPNEVARVSAELETIISGEDEEMVAQLIYSVRYREYTSMLGDSEDFNPEEFLLHHKATRVLPEGRQLGAFVLTQSSLHFYPLVNAKPSEQIHIVFKGIQCALRFDYMQEHVGIQIHTYAALWPYIIVYETEEKRENIYSYIQNRVKFRDPEEDLPRVTDLWSRGHLSNFHYLTFLNHLSGRSVLDLSQYPVFPWILSNYHGENIDLREKRNYRDLSRPVGALSSDRLQRLQVGCKQTD